MHADDDENGNTRGGFFAVDLRSFENLCEQGSLNAAIAYLILARGTGGDNRTTSWSTNAIEQRTGISRSRARLGIDLLVKHGFISIVSSGSKPRYKLAPFNTSEDYEPDWTWLPNELADLGTGLGFGAFSPIERLRKGQDLDALRLFVALYNAHSLANDGGLDWRPGGVYVDYDRVEIAQVGALKIWGFNEGLPQVYSNAPFALRFVDPKTRRVWQSFWDKLRIVQNAGLLEFVPHLMDGDTEEAEILHSLAHSPVGEPLEWDVCWQAEETANAILNDTFKGRMRGLSPSIVVPVPITSPNVSMIGIGRLRYRPKTQVTAKWYADMCDRCEEAIERYRRYATGNQLAA